MIFAGHAPGGKPKHNGPRHGACKRNERNGEFAPSRPGIVTEQEDPGEAGGPAANHQQPGPAAKYGGEDGQDDSGPAGYRISE